MESLGYIVITPARNEGKYIEKTLLSMVSQTIAPKVWVIVDDASTDNTADLIKDYARRYEWIHYVAKSMRDGSYFSSMVSTWNYGYRETIEEKYEIIGKLDADYSFGPDYYMLLLEEFKRNPKLGIAGGGLIDSHDGRHTPQRNPIEQVPGGHQTFRRKCFEDIGGLRDIPQGGDDTVAVTMARLRGWETRIFTDLPIYHLKPANIAYGGSLNRNYQMGVRDYCLGSHPVFEILKCLRRSLDTPLILGVVSRFVGFWSAVFSGIDGKVPHEARMFLRYEQLSRAFPFLRRILMERGRRLGMQ